MADDDPEDARSAGRDPRSTRLLVDAMLGTLSTYLRMCGYDAAAALDRGLEGDEEIRRVAAAEERTLITRDEGLAARTAGAVLLTEHDPLDQLRELREEGFRLELADAPSRCGRCNGPVERLPPDVDRPDYAPEEGAVWRCRDCDQYFWKGSHWEDVGDRLETLSETDPETGR